MKIERKRINFKKGIFQVTINLDEHTDDVWNVYNLLNVGDWIAGTCHRKI
jgi:stalled ribosome rescue protein Dom34